MMPPTMARTIRRVLAACCGFSAVVQSGCSMTLRAPFQMREEGIEVGDVALDQAQLAELGEHLVAQAAGVRVCSRVGSTFTDLAHPDLGRLAEPRVGLQHLR